MFDYLLRIGKQGGQLCGKFRLGLKFFSNQSFSLQHYQLDFIKQCLYRPRSAYMMLLMLLFLALENKLSELFNRYCRWKNTELLTFKTPCEQSVELNSKLFEISLISFSCYEHHLAATPPIFFET